MYWTIKYKGGLHSDVVVECETQTEAENHGLAIYRLDTVGVDPMPVSEVVESATILGDKWAGQTRSVAPRYYGISSGEGMPDITPFVRH